MVYSATHAIDDAAYKLSRSKRYAGGLAARLGLRLLTAAGAAAVGLSGGVGLVYATGLLGVATGVGLRAYLNHQDYEHNKKQLANMYRKELGAILGKDPIGITVDDLEKVAETNPTIQEQLEKEKTSRNVRTGVWMVSAFVGFAVATAIITVPMTAVGGLAAVGWGTKIVAGIVGMSSFQFSRKAFIEPAADKIFKLEHSTALEQVRALEWQRTKGKQLSHAQVMEVYIAANPSLAATIQQSFGAPFAQLGAADRQRAMLQMGESIKLDEITTAINENHMNARELAFAVHGQRSGVYADVSYKEQWDNGVAQVKEKAREAKQTVQKKAQNMKQAGYAALDSAKQFVSRGVSGESASMQESGAESTAWRDYENGREAARGESPQQGR